MSDEHQSRLWPAKLTLLALIDKVAGLSVCLIEHGNGEGWRNYRGKCRTSASRIVTRRLMFLKGPVLFSTDDFA